MAQWVTISNDELQESETYTMEAHHAGTIKGIPHAYCVKCGLLYLNNDISRKCVRWGCKSYLHPEYIRWRKGK